MSSLCDSNPFNEPPTPTRTATATATSTVNPKANDNSNADANKLAVAAGVVLLNLAPGNSNPALAFDGQGHLNLFYQTATTTPGHLFTHAQMNADGTWTNAAPAAPEFQYLNSLDLLPDPSGRLCMLWSGSQYDKNGNSVYGLFRNCQKADGTWAPEAMQAAATDTSAVFSVSRAPTGSLRAVYVSQNVLYYSPIENQGTKVLTATQLSGDPGHVLLARLAIDSNGGYHAPWVESTNNNAITIQQRDSSDGGKTWAAASQLYSGSADNPGSISFELVADPAGQAHLAWDADNSIWYSRWAAAGGWGKAVKLSGDAQASGVKLAVTKDGLARAVWSNVGTSYSVVLAMQAPGGAWGPPQTVTPTQGYGEALAVDAQGTSHVIWRGDDGLRYLAMP
jgi:hypothetical protein